MSQARYKDGNEKAKIDLSTLDEIANDGTGRTNREVLRDQRTEDRLKNEEPRNQFDIEAARRIRQNNDARTLELIDITRLQLETRLKEIEEARSNFGNIRQNSGSRSPNKWRAQEASAEQGLSKSEKALLEKARKNKESVNGVV